MSFSVMTTAEQLLTDYGEYFQQNNIIITALRSIFWFVLIILKDLVDILAGIMSAAYQLLTFDFSSLDGFIKQGTVDSQYSFSQYAFVGSLVVLVLVGIGLAMILGFQNVKGTTVLRNILFGILVIAVLPTAMNMLNNAFANATDLDEIPLGTIFKSNTYDLQYICTTGNGIFESDSGSVKINNFPDNDEWIDSLQIGAVIRGSEISGIDDVFLRKLEYNDGVAAVVDSTAKGELPFGIYFEPLATDYYYRYSVDMLPIFLAEVATILVIIFTTFKVARLSYELVIHRLFAEILALTDLAGGSKLREVLKLIGATYIVLAYCPVAVRLFLSFQNWMFGTDSPFGDSIIPSFLLLAIAMAVIDGPNLIERIFSIDAGIQSGFKAAMAAVGIGRMASGTLHGLAHGVSSIGKGVNRFADSRRTTPTAKDKRSALRSSRTWDYVNAYKDGENAANDTAKRHGSSGLKSQTTAGKKQGIQDASRKLFTNSRQAAAQLFKDNGLTSSSDSLNPASSGTMSADAISSEQEKQGAEANLQKISSPSADRTLEHALHTETQNKEAKVAPSAAEATKEKADAKGNKNLQSKKNLEKGNSASRTSGAATASNGSISRKHDSATKARFSDRAQNTQKKNNLSASLRDQRPAASPRNNPSTSTQALQSDRQNIKEPVSSTQQALRNQNKKPSVPSEHEHSTGTEKENRAERKTNLK